MATNIHLSDIINKVCPCSAEILSNSPLVGGATFVTFRFKKMIQGTRAAIILRDESVFFSYRVLSNRYPREPKDIGKYRWLYGTTGQEGILINGIPARPYI